MNSFEKKTCIRTDTIGLDVHHVIMTCTRYELRQREQLEMKDFPRNYLTVCIDISRFKIDIFLQLFAPSTNRNHFSRLFTFERAPLQLQTVRWPLKA